jgi:hypothetical protein
MHKNKILPASLELGIANINQNNEVKMVTGQKLIIEDNSLDLVVLGAILEHADLDQALPKLISMTKKGGYLVCVMMNTNMTGSLFGKIYRFTPVSPEKLAEKFKFHGCRNVTPLPLKAREFPTNLTRFGLIIQK